MRVRPLNGRRNKPKPESLWPESSRPKTKESSRSQYGSEDFLRKKGELWRRHWLGDWRNLRVKLTLT